MIQPFFERGDVSATTSGDGDIWLIAIHELERGVEGATVALGVECKLSSREMIDPVVLLMITEHSEVGFDLLVFALDFAVALWVVGGGQPDSNAEPLEEGSHESGGKLGTTIGMYDPR